MLTTSAFILLLVFLHCNAKKYPEVVTPLGKVRGFYKTTYEGRTIAAFEGIPYAKPPIGNLRFEEPQEVEPWQGIRKATNSSECIQLTTESVIGDEDCLYINVYVPRGQPNTKDNLDVIFSIHGGGFTSLSANSLTHPDFLLDRDLLLVTFNYRLGVLECTIDKYGKVNVIGFLSTEDEVVSGNLGLKDQTFALKWVQKNIKSFGGNPDSVTIDGESAGGVSAHYHYISPLSRGLFHRGFSHSGTVLNPFAVNVAPLENTRKLAAAVGCSNTSTKDLVECLKRRPAHQLIEVSQRPSFLFISFASFGPVVESRTKGAFIPDHPYKLLANGEINDVPWINSHNTQDGSIPGLYVLEYLDNLKDNWENVAQHILGYNYTLSDADRPETFKRIKEFYFGNREISYETFAEVIKLLTDRYYKLDAIRASQLQSKVANSSVYTLVYGYKGSYSLIEMLVPGLDFDFGVGHGDDLLYLYAAYYSKNITLSAADKQIKSFWLDLYASYAATGVPKIQKVNWKPTGSSSKDLTYLELITPNNITMKTDSNFLEAMKFWDSLPLKENEHLCNITNKL